MTDDAIYSDKVEYSICFSDDSSNYEYNNYFSNYNNPIYYKLVKFFEDYIFSSVILIIVFPLMFAVAILIKLTSKGPVFYRQTRVGINGKIFRVYKFRTMLFIQDNGFVKQAYKGDSRITKLGSIIRRTSLDELPQLFNILRGEMSLIGPRPHAVPHDIEFSRHNGDYLSRQLVKPGITGLAQIKGFRGEIKKQYDIEGRINSDLQYIKNWSPYLDLKIIILTFIKGFVHKNAY